MRTLLVGNWKMNLDLPQAKELFLGLAPACANLKQSEVWVAPPFTTIPLLSELLPGTKIKLGAQNVHWELSGAFTGEVSASMLKELSCKFAVVGHSERRHVFGETNELVRRRFLGALKSGLTVILCIGETLTEKDQGARDRVLEAQLSTALESCTSDQLGQVVLAYEPVWAIGTGRVATNKEIVEANDSIVAVLRKITGKETLLPILYGGSVTPENFAEILSIRSVAGALVGGASLSLEKFLGLVSLAEQRSPC